MPLYFLNILQSEVAPVLIEGSIIVNTMLSLKQL